MMYFKDSTLLAYAKLRTRKIRLFITIIVSGLLLSFLVAAAFVSRGAFASIADFSKEGFGDRYILSAQPVVLSSQLYNDKDSINKAISRQKELITKKKTAAQKLNVEYDGSSELSTYSEYDGQNGREKTLDTNNPISKQVAIEYIAARSNPGIPELKKLTKDYKPKGFYESPPSIFNGQQYTYLQVLKDGSEQYDTRTDLNQNPNIQTGTATFSSQWGLLSKELLKPFLIEGSSLDIGSDGSYPVVAPYTAVEQLLKLKPLAAGATNKQKLDRIKQVREGAKELNFSVCYRNETSQKRLINAIDQQRQITKDSNKKGYVKPDLIYSNPTTACGDITVNRDVRSKEVKDLANRELQFRQQFGEPVPKSNILNFRVVGISPDPGGATNSASTALLSSFLSSSINVSNSTWFTPLQVGQKSPDLSNILLQPTANSYNPTTYFVEFSDVKNAKEVLDKLNCNPDYSVTTNGKDPNEICVNNGKTFNLAAFGSSSLALDGVKKIFSKSFTAAALVFVAISTVIMIGTVGRIIADSRRETSVFRAIGAKRSDIAQVYFTYTVLLALLISAFALIVGLIISSIIQHKYAGDMTISSIVVFNAQDLNKQFWLLRVDIRDVLKLVGITIVAGLTSAILPLITNLRRSPIKDMRDEN